MIHFYGVMYGLKYVKFTLIYNFQIWYNTRVLRTVFVKILKRLSLSLSAYLCIQFYWLSWLRQASHRKLIQNSALRLRLRRFKILTCPLLKTKTMAVQNLFRYISFYTSTIHYDYAPRSQRSCFAHPSIDVSVCMDVCACPLKNLSSDSTKLVDKQEVIV